MCVRERCKMQLYKWTWRRGKAEGNKRRRGRARKYKWMHMCLHSCVLFFMCAFLCTGSKYALLPNGDLVIKSVEPMDAFKGYRCKVQSKLTSEAITSVNSGKVIVTGELLVYLFFRVHSPPLWLCPSIFTWLERGRRWKNVCPLVWQSVSCATRHHLTFAEPHRPVPAKIADFYSTVGVYEGESLFLPCILQGFPIPSSVWYKGRKGSPVASPSASSLVYTSSSSSDQSKSSDGVSTSHPVHFDIRRDPRVTVFDKIGLLIEKVSPSDAGFYSCHANNSGGRDTIQTEVSVYGKSLFLFSHQ